MSTPYWGQLPGPKVAQATHAGHYRRKSESDDSNYNADRRSSMDIPPVRRANRTSTHTQATDLQSESTFNPRDSPSSFAAQGLAPRPPSYQRGHSRRASADTADFRGSRRPSRTHEDFDDAGSPAPPAAPEVPRGPPVSYRHPFGNGGLPYTHPTSGATAGPSQSTGPVLPEDEDFDDMEAEEYYKSSAGRTGGSQPPEGAPGDDGRRSSSSAAVEALTLPKRATTGKSDRRKKFANDRSPLQRLELTLDSMTKEEKRARVEAAEQRARERAALKAGKQPAYLQPPSHDRHASVSYDRRASAPVAASHQHTQRAVSEGTHHAALGDVTQEAPREVPRETSREVPREDYQDEYQEDDYPENYPEDYADDYREDYREDYTGDYQHHQEDYREVSRGVPKEITIQKDYSTHRQGPLSQNPPKETHYYSSGALQEPEEALPVQRHSYTSSGVPQRNMSFRERAVRDSARFSDYVDPEPEPEPKPQPVKQQPQSSSGGFSLTRSGSNKLKKDPPGDPWYRMKRELAEKHEQELEQSRRESWTVPTPNRNKELPPAPSDNRRPSVDIGSRTTYTAVSGDNQGIRRRATEPVSRADYSHDEDHILPVTRGKTFSKGDKDVHADREDAAAAHRRAKRADSFSSDDSHHHRFSNMVFKPREQMTPGDGLYLRPKWLDEWKKATVGTLSGTLLEIKDVKEPQVESHWAPSDPNRAWWEQDNRRSSYPARSRKAEAFDGEYDENAPTRFKPQMYLKCGPLLRYCGIRREKTPPRTQYGSAISDREIWRGTVMIVTKDSESSYEIAPTLRLFVQDIELLPSPPHRVKGDLPPEYVDPISGHPKLGRRGETLYVRPVEHLKEAKDLSRDETDQGLFEQSRSQPDVPLPDGLTDLPGSFASRRKRVGIDGEKVQKYKDVRGFRLHAERGCTFWRFNIEVELREKQQRIAYRINRGPATGFWVPARKQTMNMMFYSCNGFSLNVKPDELSGPDPMWRDVLNSHQANPFHLMIGGGDQIYNDCVTDEAKLFQEWLEIRNPTHKHTASLTPQMQDELETFYLERYCMWYSQGLFSLANSQIPMVNMYDDHDIFDGYGSYPHHNMNSPVFRGLGAVAFKYYMLFQQQSTFDETETSEPSWILGAKRGPYMDELSRSIFVSVGAKAALLAVDARMERTEHDVVSDQTWEKIMNRLYAELRRGQVEHLLVLLGVPIAYPRMVWLENILTSRLMDPVKALGRTGIFGKALNSIDGGVEVLDDLNDHWTAKNHKQERAVVIEDLQDLAIDKSVRVTILSGDVHLAAVGQFYSNPKLGLPKHKDPRYMPNIISSAIVNTPPPDLLADVLNKRNKVHHFDKQTDENMIPMFPTGVDGKARNNKHLLPHRNWCAIREWAPGATPPPSPPPSAYERSPSLPPKKSGGGGLLRRLSLSKNRPSPSVDSQDDLASRDSVRGPRPPVTRSGGGLFRSLSRRSSTSKKEKPAELTRSMSVGRGESPKKGGFFSFGRRSSQRRPDDGGINGTWGDDPEYDDDYWDEPQPSRQRGSGLRGGAAYDEYSEGDDSHYMTHPQAPRRAATTGSQGLRGQHGDDEEFPPTRPFHRTPTGLSTKQKKKADMFEVDLEGGLDICLNVEVNPKDPAGITMPYRLLVPKLLYEYKPEVDDISAAPAEPEAPAVPAAPAAPAEPTGLMRLLSFRKKPQKPQPQPHEEDDYDSDEEAFYRQGGR